MSNKNVQNAAANVVAEGARTAFQQQTGLGGNAGAQPSYGSPGRF